MRRAVYPIFYFNVTPHPEKRQAILEDKAPQSSPISVFRLTNTELGEAKRPSSLLTD